MTALMDLNVAAMRERKWEGVFGDELRVGTTEQKFSKLNCLALSVFFHKFL
jgi:hypothetical protein